VFTTLPVGTTIMARTVRGTDASVVARQIQREVFSQGAEATTIQEIFDSASAGTVAIVWTMRVLMGIGLLVGVLSLGILALRAVVERRRTIGVLRALGYRPAQVLVGVVSEALITATGGAGGGSAGDRGGHGRGLSPGATSQRDRQPLSDRLRAQLVRQPAESRSSDGRAAAPDGGGVEGRVQTGRGRSLALRGRRLATRGGRAD